MGSDTTDVLLDELGDDVNAGELIRDINETQLPSSVETLARRYDEEVGIRSEFVWKWIYVLFEHCTLGSVPEARMEATRTRKTLFTMFITVLDDIAEDDLDRTTFEQARKIPFPAETPETTPGTDETQLSMAQAVWDEFTDQLADAPRRDEFITQFRFDTRQAINSMDYSLLTSESPDVATRTGALHYSPHNMVVFPYIDVDLMASPDFLREDLAALRELLWKAQRMARIGNWVSTWKRELPEGDYSSGVVIWALRDGVVTPEDLRERPDDAIAAIEDSGVEADLLDRWYDIYDDVESFEESATSVDFDKAIERLKAVMFFHLASEGHK